MFFSGIAIGMEVMTQIILWSSIPLDAKNAITTPFALIIWIPIAVAAGLLVAENTIKKGE